MIVLVELDRTSRTSRVLANRPPTPDSSRRLPLDFSTSRLLDSQTGTNDATTYGSSSVRLDLLNVSGNQAPQRRSGTVNSASPAGKWRQRMRHRINAAAIGTAAGLLGTADAAAQSLRDRFFGDGDEFIDVASAGNGGVATASASGGAVSIGNINSGGNTGCAIGIGDTFGPDPDVTGCTILNTTGLDVAVDGGTAIADASGGDYNLAFV